MTTKSKESLSGAIETSTGKLGEIENSLSELKNLTVLGYFKELYNKLYNSVKDLFGSKESGEQTSEGTTSSSKKSSVETSAGATSSSKESKKISETGADKISNGMFQQLLKMEGSQDFVAHAAPQFGEKFVTGPYGMVYKHIDSSGNLLKTPTSFKNGEHVSKTWAENNAKAHYDKCAEEWKKSLEEKGLKYNQNELDSLVSASGGTAKSKERLKNYVVSHWNDKNAIFNFMSNFATTAAGNGKKMPGLVRRRKFEANWFIGNEKPFESYKA